MAANREQDERLLSMVRGRAEGLSLEKLAKRLGGKSAPMGNQTNKVMDADLEASATEDQDEIRAAYWPRKE